MAQQGEADLTAAEILAAAETYDYFTCAFHCQQAAEKFLKAFLVCHQIEFRKTHDLGELLKLASQAELPGCEWLTPFGIEFRYPGDQPEVDWTMAQNALAEAKRLRQVIMKHLASYLAGEEHAGSQRA